MIHTPDVWRCPTRRQENLHTASKRWTSRVSVCRCSFWERVVCNPRLRETRRVSMGGRGPSTCRSREDEVHGIKDRYSEMRQLRAWAYAFRNPKAEKVKRSFPDCRKFERRNVYCFRKYILLRKAYVFTTFYLAFYLSFDRLFDFVSVS